MKPLDITYCTGDDCPLKDNCKRYVIHPMGIASWMEAPYIDELQGCLYYIPDKEEK